MLTPLIDAETLRNTVSPEVYVAVFDDTNCGDLAVIDVSGPVTEVIDDANMLVLASLPANYATIPDGADTSIPVLLKTAVRLYLRYFTFIRRPEYTRVTGRDESGLLEYADKIMGRIRAGILQIPPKDNPQHIAPGNLGGIVYESGPRTMVDSADGTFNGGDF